MSKLVTTYTSNTRSLLSRALHHARYIVIIPLIATTLAACGDDDDDPTPTATTAAPTSTTTTAPASPPATVTTSAPAQTTASSPVAENLTAGELADRINAAWPSVTSYRTTTTSMPITGEGTPASAASVVTVAEVILPDRKHWVSQTNGVTQYEFITVDGRLYGRGPALPGGEDEASNSTSWFEIDPTTVDANSVFAPLYEQLMAPVTAPYTSLSAEERARDAIPVESRTVEDRTCAAYQIADTTQTGERFEIVIAIGDDDLPARSKPAAEVRTS